MLVIQDRREYNVMIVTAYAADMIMLAKRDVP
jgi:hypothetical protein